MISHCNMASPNLSTSSPGQNDMHGISTHSMFFSRSKSPSFSLLPSSRVSATFANKCDSDDDDDDDDKKGANIGKEKKPATLHVQINNQNNIMKTDDDERKLMICFTSTHSSLFATVIMTKAKKCNNVFFTDMMMMIDVV